MFDHLSQRLAKTFKQLKGHGKLSERNIADALREVRLALLEADVHYKVAKDFVASVRQRAVGQEVMQSLTPAQQVIKIVHDELARLMGAEAAPLDLGGRPPLVLMLVGLQGSGKTTTAAKLALMLKKQGRHPYLVPADLRRPAAIEQLTRLGGQISVPVHQTQAGADAVEVCQAARALAGQSGADTVILDTAGRQHLDQELMAELGRIHKVCSPREVLLVADAMTGQDAVNVAQAFQAQVGLTGVVLTKIEGDARGGAALSIRAVTQVPIKLVGVGEKLDALEPFHPERLAGRILGMGDVLSLVEKASQDFDEAKARELAAKIRGDRFTLADFRDQLRQLGRMGSLESLLGMLPGANKLGGMKNLAMDEKELARFGAIIDSMTPGERADHLTINASRRKRIAKGSGTKVADVNRLLKNFGQARKMMKNMSKMGGHKAMRGLLPF